jgi:murein L,D-transpeptidase YafK
MEVYGSVYYTMGRNKTIKIAKLLFVAICCALATGTSQTLAHNIDDDPRAGLMPEALVSLGSQGSYALVVSKGDSRLDVYQQFENGKVEKVATYRTSTGRGIGDKLVEGDLKTPEGVYYFVRIREDRELPSKYGIRAFDLNYPNKIDLLENKTGYGIWLHGTDEPERLGIPRTSEGCVVLSNEDVKKISDYLTLYRTPVIISEDVTYTDVSVLDKDRKKIRQFVSDWLEAWSKQDIENYKKFYHEDFRGGGKRQKAWFNVKKRVFEATSWADIRAADLKILRHRDEIVVSFYQNYHSNLMDDTGVKWVYLKENHGKLGIISEEWHSVSNIRTGKHWNQQSVQLAGLVKEIGGIVLDKQGKIRVANPTLQFNTKEEQIANLKQPEQKEITDNSDTLERFSGDTGLVRVENARIIDDRDRNIVLEFDVRNKQQTGKRRRGWVYIIATWDNGKEFTSFPQGVQQAVPRNPKQGDSYGIRWFKTVLAELPKPEADSELTAVHAFVYDQNGNQIGGYEIIQNPSEVQ